MANNKWKLFQRVEEGLVGIFCVVVLPASTAMAYQDRFGHTHIKIGTQCWYISDKVPLIGMRLIGLVGLGTYKDNPPLFKTTGKGGVPAYLNWWYKVKIIRVKRQDGKGQSVTHPEAIRKFASELMVSNPGVGQFELMKGITEDTIQGKAGSLISEKDPIDLTNSTPDEKKAFGLEIQAAANCDLFDFGLEVELNLENVENDPALAEALTKKKMAEVGIDIAVNVAEGQRKASEIGIHIARNNAEAQKALNVPKVEFINDAARALKDVPLGGLGLLNLGSGFSASVSSGGSSDNQATMNKNSGSGGGSQSSAGKRNKNNGGGGNSTNNDD